MFLSLFLLPIVWHAFISICSLAEISKYINWEILAKWLTMTLHDLLFCKSYMKIITMNSWQRLCEILHRCLWQMYFAEIHFAVLFRERKFPWLSWWFPKCNVFPVSWLFPTVFPGVFFSIIKALDSLYHAYKQIIILYPNQGFLVNWQRSIIGATINVVQKWLYWL